MKGKAVYKAFVYFEVNKKGKVVNVKVMDDKKNKLPRELQRQAYDAVQTLPEFNPGKNNVYRKLKRQARASCSGFFISFWFYHHQQEHLSH
jgi:hypothetical protein